MYWNVLVPEQLQGMLRPSQPMEPCELQPAAEYLGPHAFCEVETCPTVFINDQECTGECQWCGPFLATATYTRRWFKLRATTTCRKSIFCGISRASTRVCVPDLLVL